MSILTAGTNVSFDVGSTYNGSSAVTISSTDTNTEYTPGTGLTLSGTEFSTDAIPNASLQNTTISGKALGSDLDSLTAGTNVTFDVGSMLDENEVVNAGVLQLHNKRVVFVVGFADANCMWAFRRSEYKTSYMGDASDPTHPVIKSCCYQRKPFKGMRRTITGEHCYGAQPQNL